MSQFISPGVYTVERDLSQYVSDLSKTIVAMVGTAVKGPSNTPTLITSAQQFVDLFGEQNPKHYLGYAVQAYLKRGNTVYVTRVAPPNATKAKVAMVLPKTATPFAGRWSLVSNADNEAVFKVSDFTGYTGSKKTITLDDNTIIPGFDFTDPTGLSAANNKLGSDLSSFIGNTDAINNYIKGSTLTITTGSGKDSSVAITGLLGDKNAPQLKVNATKFRSFNSPLTATAVGEIAIKALTTLPATSTVLATIGYTNVGKVNSGDINLVYDVAGTSYDSDVKKQTLSDVLTGVNDAAKLAELDKLITVVTANSVVTVNIAIPLFLDAAKSYVLINAVLTSLINVFRTKTSADLTAYTNLSAAFLNARAQSASGIVGLGSIDATGHSSGIKATDLVLNTANVPTAVRLYAINTGANGICPVEAGLSSIETKDMEISGTFTTDIFRPTWDFSDAGDSRVPTYLKFTSIGEGDFSDVAITLNFVPGNLSNGEQVYTVRVYKRLTADTVSTDSVLSSDFLLVEQFDGTPETLQSNINGSSRIVNLKIDYTTQDIASLVTGGVVYGAQSDHLAIDPVLNTDLTGKGITLGTNVASLGSAFVPSFGLFLTGGSAGSEITKSDLIGDSATKTGIYSYSDPEQLDINLLVVPGWSADPAVAKAMISLCESRSDCMAIIDTPFALSVQGVINYRKNILNANTNYAALYYPWVKVTDSVNKKDIFMPPSGLVAAQYAYNDMVGEVYTAPAGRQRGNIVDALATERILNQGDRDLLALNQINPIHFEAGYGTYIRGQMTLQTATTALDRVNVRRLLLKLRKVIATASKYFEFEPGDSITAMRLKQLAETVLDDHQRKGAIREYKVDVGPSVNTALSLENNEMRMSISLVPTKTAEKIIEIFNILGQGKGISIS